MTAGIKSLPKILLAEDDHTIAHMVLRVLQAGVSYDVTWVKDGQEALERVDEVQPDLLLLDLMMPHRNGFEVCRSLRNDSKWNGVPICILTALTDQQAHQAAIGAGADRILLKPFRANELRLAIRSLLEKEAAERFLVEALEKARTSQNDLVRFLAHDLRGPMTVLRSSLSILKKTVQDSAQTELIESGQEAVLRLAAMVDSIIIGLDSSQLNTLPMNDVFDLITVAKESTAELRVLFDARELSVSLRFDEAPCTIRGRRDLFRTALVNLLINAVEHSPLEGELVIQGGINPAGDFQITISDQGPGISPEAIAEIFSAEELPGLKAQGVRLGRGLGLVVARAAAQRLGGQIEVVSPHNERFATAIRLTISQNCFLSNRSNAGEPDQVPTWSAPARIAVNLRADTQQYSLYTTNVSQEGATLCWKYEETFPSEASLLVSLAVSPQAKANLHYVLQEGTAIEVKWDKPTEEFIEFMNQVRNSLP